VYHLLRHLLLLLRQLTALHNLALPDLPDIELALRYARRSGTQLLAAQHSWLHVLGEA
jgi:hypothetical protein